MIRIRDFYFFTEPNEAVLEAQKRGFGYRVIWVANPVQMDFWRCNSKVKALFGANRSGKTEAVLIDVVWRLLGVHPFLDVPKPPVYIRWILPDYGLIQMTLRPKFERYLPPSALRGGSWEKAYSDRYHTLFLRNGSRIDFRSHKVGLLGLEGVSLDAVVIDEECPYEVYRTCLMRTLDTDGQVLISATPLKGLTWLYTEVWQKADGELISVFQTKIEDNKAIAEESLSKIKRLVDDPRRLSGEFTDIRVFPELTTEHIAPPPVDGIYFGGFDWGYRHKSALVVLLVSDGKVWVMDVWEEPYLSIGEAVSEMKRFVGGRYEPITIVYDSQLDAPDTTGVPPSHKVVGSFTAIPATKKEQHSLAVVNELLRRRLLFFNDKPSVRDLFSRMQRYAYKEFGEKTKENDDAIDALRYGVYWLWENGFLQWKPHQPSVEDDDILVETAQQRMKRIILQRRNPKPLGNIFGRKTV